VNCAAIPINLVESEFFGHEKGAFTGATAKRDGRFALADGGTIFLDEIAELTPDIQAKLLRVLQESEFEPVGSSRTRKVDVRVLAATNRDLSRAVEEGEFREDLFYRLNVFPIRVPPLRERGDDVILLAETFVKKFAARAARQMEPLSDECVRRLRAYSWPGNVRELENVIERAVILCDSERIAVRDLPQNVTAPEEASPGANPPMLCLKRARRALEADLIRRALQATDGNRTHAARLLEISHRALLYKIKEYGIRD
jgi:transcriptional regulator with GAF, ATPase, and Fis domain